MEKCDGCGRFAAFGVFVKFEFDLGVSEAAALLEASTGLIDVKARGSQRRVMFKGVRNGVVWGQRSSRSAKGGSSTEERGYKKGSEMHTKRTFG